MHAILYPAVILIKEVQRANGQIPGMQATRSSTEDLLEIHSCP